MHSPETLAYLAGWFEARGYCRIGCQKYRVPRLTVYIRAPEDQIKHFMTLYPGTSIQHLRTQCTRGQSYTHGTISPGGYNWTLTRLNAFNFLSEITPYCIFRRNFVDKSVEFLRRTTFEDEPATTDLQVLVEEIRRIGKLRL